MQGEQAIELAKYISDLPEDQIQADRLGKWLNECDEAMRPSWF